jgi:signal transduction histidine kinase
LLGVLEDVTEERSSLRAKNRVKKLERLGQLSGIVAHDFNNLLCSIMGHAELLTLSYTNNEERRYESSLSLG